MKNHIDILPEVEAAILENRAVVALESTIISHGMPYPQNLDCAKTCEALIREKGAVPATMAILDGRIKVGLTDNDLERLATEKDVLKCSRRDVPYAISAGKSGAATVSATMIMASLAGIKFFATGGVGGVHRGAEDSMDISADLTELGATDVCVISAGVKSILDIERTLEFLETQGVPVVAYGQNEFPAFYTQTSGFKAPLRLNTPAEVATMLKAKWELGLKGGAIIGNPIPEEYAMPKEEIDSAINSALKKATEKGIAGKEITPFLLSEIKEITKGRSLESNMQLVYANAKLAAEIAVAYWNS
ncbi:MAG: pseudouridine-5'-phosphate glycosidase [Oscillospiraceae bacterium]|nr:pseudouridine-5'-phosphate glycosidase [Oscillospiraceae bacterium]